MLLCEPNVSEGRDAARMDRLADAVSGTAGVELIHRSADADHNRMVLAYRGPAEEVTRATEALAAVAFEEIDLRDHRGQHPRIGAMDVVPFLPCGGAAEADALSACRAFATWVASRDVPVFYYERAATRPGRGSLPAIRRGQFEGLSRKLEDPAWTPDAGPDRPHPSAGAVVTGVRAPLVRFNVNLDVADPTAARAIASRIRESGGGLPHVRALGIALARRGLSQISMNLTRHTHTSVAEVFQRLEREALAEGVGIVGSELIGPVPRGALDGIDLDRLGIALHAGQIIDLDAVPETGVIG